MKQKKSIIFSICAASVIIWSACCGAMRGFAAEKPRYVPGEIIIKYRYTSTAVPKIKVSSPDLEHHIIADQIAAAYSLVLKVQKSGLKCRSLNTAWNTSAQLKSFAPGISRGFTRKFIITLTDTSADIDALSRELNGNVRPLENRYVAIEQAYPNYILETSGTPNDPWYPEQWNLQRIRIPDAWKTPTVKGKDIVVAVIDTGVDYNHPDLWESVWVNPDVITDYNGDRRIDLDDCDGDGNKRIDAYEIVHHMFGWDFVSESTGMMYPGEDGSPPDNDPMDFHGHGTHCAGIIGATVNNGIGIAGIAPRARIMALRAGYKNSSGNGELAAADVEEAILYAVQHGADIITMSFSTSMSGVCREELAYAYEQGVVLVAAAGNDHTDVRRYPAAYPCVISVGATERNGAMAYFSNYGSWVDIAAPGVAIAGTLPDRQYGHLDGTSAACPHIAGIAAMLRGENNGYRTNDILWTLKQTVCVLPEIEHLFYPGFGEVDAAAALRLDQTPPRIEAAITQVHIDYSFDTITITGTCTGEDFLSGDIHCRYTNDDEWQHLYSLVSPVREQKICTWNITDALKGTYCLRLTARGVNGGEVIAYQTVDISPLMLADEGIMIQLSSGKVKQSDILYVMGKLWSGARIQDIKILDAQNNELNLQVMDMVHIDVFGNVSGEIPISSVSALYPLVTGIRLLIEKSDDVVVKQFKTQIVLIEAEGNSISCYNNVFNPASGERAVIKLDMSAAGHALVTVYDSSGRKVRGILDTMLTSGIHTDIFWDGIDDNGNKAGSGLYFVHLETDMRTETKKVVIVR